MSRYKRRWTTAAGLVALAAALVIPATRAAAATPDESRRQRDSIYITKNRQFDPAHGVVAGTGTKRDPYLISGWRLRHLYIKDTSRHVRIVDNEITGTLTLDWIGDGVDVRDNYIGDLRVNQNVRRKGEMTSGIIADNEIGVVGQLRHWDGLFTRNTVGDPSAMEVWPFEFRAVNFDGFNGGRFTNNVVYGFIDATLHGHHHSSGFQSAESSHYHGGPARGNGHMDDVDHSNRYHRVYISDNTIFSDFHWALRYNDVGHAGNDRTAASETNPALNDPHVHHTRVYLTGNKLIGSGLWVDVFNAKDREVHLGTATGLVVIRGNDVELIRDDSPPLFSHYRVGISIQRAEDVMVSVAGNRVTGFVPDSETPVVGDWFNPYTTGIELWDIDKAHISLGRNFLAQHKYGIYAQSMTKSVYWHISRLRTENVEHEVYYDGNNVANPPEDNP